MTCHQEPCLAHSLPCTALQELWERGDMGTCIPPSRPLQPRQEGLTSQPEHSQWDPTVRTAHPSRGRKRSPGGPRERRQRPESSLPQTPLHSAPFFAFCLQAQVQGDRPSRIYPPRNILDGIMQKQTPFIISLHHSEKMPLHFHPGGTRIKGIKD